MAELSGPSNGGDRGQLMLVGAVSLAVLLVTLGLILNSVAYSGVLAASDAPGEDRTVVRYQDDVRRGVGGLMVRTNRQNNSSHADLEAALRTNVEAWADLSARHAAARGVGTDVATTDTTNGTRIAQDDGSRNLTDAAGARNWTLATDVTATRQVELDVSSPNGTLGEYGSGEEFRLVVTNGTAEWRMNVTANATGVVVGIRNASGGHAVCQAPSARPEIDVTGGTVGGSECRALVFAEGVSPPYDVRYERADNLTGTYGLVVDNETLASEAGSDDRYASDGSPYATPAIYSAHVTVDYRTPRLTYRTRVRISPGESP